MTWRNWLIPAVLLAICGCDRRPAGDTGPGGGQTMSIRITSTAFGNGQPVPKKYTGEGQDVSPALSWQGVPAGAKELALIVDDPDAPTPQAFGHRRGRIDRDIRAEVRGTLPRGTVPGHPER